MERADRTPSHRQLFGQALNLAISMTPGYDRKPEPMRKGAAPLLSDAETLVLLRRHLIGKESQASICREQNISQDTFGKWVQGINRGHLRTQIDREVMKANQR